MSLFPIIALSTFNLNMAKKECPSCAMEIDASAKVCPVCSYQFPEQPRSLRWIAVLLAIIMLGYILYSALR